MPAFYASVRHEPAEAASQWGRLPLELFKMLRLPHSQ